MLVYVLAQGTSACTDQDRDLLLMYESADFPFILPLEFLTFQDTILFLYLFPYSFFFSFLPWFWKLSPSIEDGRAEEVER